MTNFMEFMIHVYRDMGQRMAHPKTIKVKGLPVQGLPVQPMLNVSNTWPWLFKYTLVILVILFS